MKLYKLLLEIESDLNEDYPESFNFEELKNIKSFNGKVNYVKTHLGKHLGRGSSRIVFDTGDNKVIKIALNKKGLIQNESESYYKDDFYIKNNIAEIFDYDEDGFWIEMEKAKKATKNDFERLWNVKFDDLKSYLLKIYSQNHGRNVKFNNIENELHDNDYVIDIVDIMMNYDLLVGDLVRINSWGIINRNGEEKIVLIDIGLNTSDFNKYYK